MKIRILILLAASVVGGVFTAAFGADDVRIESVAVGFGGRYRPGHLTPLFVRIANGGLAPLDGELRAVQADDDGDRVQWRLELDVAAGSSTERMILVNPPPGAFGEGRIEISIGSLVGGRYRPLDAFHPGARVGYGHMLTTPLVDGERVIGVLGTGLGGLGVLNSPDRVYTGEPIRVVSIPFSRVPPSWRGLDMIDVLYWDDPDPQQLNDAQQEAIARWVRRGGRLVMGLGSHAMELSSSPGALARLMPVKVRRMGERVSDLRPLYRFLGGVASPGGRTVVAVTPLAGARVLVRDDVKKLPLLCRRTTDAGSVTVMSATLGDSGLVDPRKMLTRRRAGALATLVGMQVLNGPRYDRRSISLTDDLPADLDSAGVGGMLVGLVVLLCLLYAAIAGPGTWFYARATDRRRLSWWLFAAVVAVATLASAALSLFGVRSTSISNALVLDLTAGSGHAVVRGNFGLYVPTHSRPDIDVGGDPFASLVPMIDPRGGASGEFPDVKSYEIRLDKPTHLSVPIRRTIKRFALTWQGDVGGTVDGSVRVGAAASADGSVRYLSGTVTNRLDVDLLEATILYAQPHWKYPFAVIEIGRIAAGKTITFDTAPVEGGRPRSRYVTRTLRAKQLAMLGMREGDHGVNRNLGAGVLSSFAARVSLLSTMGLYPQPVSDQGPRPLERDCFGRLDRSGEIDFTQALLIARADAYMPADVRVNGDVVECTGPTVVRVLLPATIKGPTTVKPPTRAERRRDAGESF